MDGERDGWQGRLGGFFEEVKCREGWVFVFFFCI